MRVADGVIVVLSYPDTVVRPAYTEFSSKIWPFFGVGGKDAVQAGHAALLLINKQSRSVDYYDFGRYITSFGYGRVRSKDTDVELQIPLKAVFEEGKLQNIDELLLWLDAHPEKTHGEGRLVASVNYSINYHKALKYIDSLIQQKEIPYGAFVKRGSNCARFVTDTVINSCQEKSVRTKLKASNLFTPSPIGNAIKGTDKDEVFVIENQIITQYHNRSILKEYAACFFKKIDIEVNKVGTELPNKDLFNLNKGTWLGGIGSGAWFRVESFLGNNNYEIARYTAQGNNDFKGVFKLETPGFSPDSPYTFLHPSNCQEAYIAQGDEFYEFKRTS
ncbi:DUF6695 family protein [Wenyingzhuangia sp. IMCC45533]